MDVVLSDLAVYDDDEPPGDYSIATEIAALDRELLKQAARRAVDLWD